MKIFLQKYKKISFGYCDWYTRSGILGRVYENNKFLMKEYGIITYSMLDRTIQEKVIIVFDQFIHPLTKRTINALRDQGL
jgi:hypothetical protein